MSLLTRFRRPGRSASATAGALIHVPAAWRGPDDLLLWVAADGTEGAGSLRELPALDQPCLVLGWPSVSWVRATVPAALERHPQALAAALEEHLLEPPETVFATVAGRDGEAVICALTARARLRRLLEHLATRNIHPSRAVPEAWIDGRPGKTLLTAEGGWTYGAHGLPLMLDRWSAGQAPALLTCLAADEAFKSVELHCAPGVTTPDPESWSKELNCPVTVGAPWSWTQAATVEAPDILCFEFRVRPPLSRSALAMLKPLALGAALLAVLETGMSALDWGRQAWRQRELQSALTEAYRGAFPGDTPLLSPMLQARRAYGDLRRSAGEWADDDFIPLATRSLPVIGLLPTGSLKALALENHTLLLEAEPLKGQEARLATAAAQAGLTTRLRPDGRLAITPGGRE